jgi:hypothetical protein
MASLKDTAKKYEPTKTKNIADLDVVDLSLPVEERTGKDNAGKEFAMNVIVVEHQDYRVPDSVLKDIKSIVEAKPTLKTVKVIKKGTGMQTAYTVIPLD